MPMTQRSHLFPFRTQKLSSVVPKILGWRRPGKIGRRRLQMRIKPNADGHSCFWDSAFLYRWPVGQAVKTAASHAANGSSILPRVTMSEWTPFHLKSPAIRLGFSHTISSFLLNPTKLCVANFCGGPAAEEADGSLDMRENIIADKARSLTGLFCLKRPPCFSTVMGAFC